MSYPRWVYVLLGRCGIGHSPSAHAAGLPCRACPRNRQPLTWAEIQAGVRR